MNEKNLEILRWLQRDGSLSMDDLADRVNLSKTAVWRRVKKLEEDGVIRKTMAVVDEKAVGFGVTVFAIVRTNQHNDAWYNCFANAVASIPEIMDVYRASGDIDYILRIIARNMDHYDEVYRRLIRKCEFSDVSSTFVMETIKESRELPL
jgi:Lrp/AsnC family transcriptional regulator